MSRGALQFGTDIPQAVQYQMRSEYNGGRTGHESHSIRVYRIGHAGAPEVLPCSDCKRSPIIPCAVHTVSTMSGIMGPGRHVDDDASPAQVQKEGAR